MKLPKPVRRGDSWRVRFMYKGQDYNATFDTSLECHDWAARKIVQLKDDERNISEGKLPNHTLSELLLLYVQKVSSTKKGADIEPQRIKAFLRDYADLASKNLSEITPQMLTAWRNQRMTEVVESTARRDMNLIASAFTYAVKELYWIKENPFARVKRPKSAKPRHRRVTGDEVDRILSELGYVRGTC
ncbi:MAG: hypothetical protein WA154_00735 [Moraxellaceae bacterium]